MRKSPVLRIVAIMLVVMMSVMQFGVIATARSTTSAEELESIKALLSALPYEEYLDEFDKITYGEDSIVIPASSYDAETSTADIVVFDSEGLADHLSAIYLNQSKVTDSMSENVKGKTEEHNKYNKSYLETMLEDAKSGMKDADKVVYVGDTGVISFPFSVKTSGFYNIELEYMATEANANDIERGIMIDGIYQYKESRTVSFQGRWVDELDSRFDRGFLNDINGNEIRPLKVASPAWTSRYVYDSTGYYASPLDFYIEAGDHVLTIKSTMGSMVLKNIYINVRKTPPTYEEVSAEYSKKGYTSASAKPVKVQAECMSYCSDQVIQAVNDRTSAATEPQDASKVFLNTMGGSKWASNGQWVEWDIEVPEDGLYHIITRFKQDTQAGMYVTRKLYIDGEVPFAEAENIKFNYDSSWQVQPIGVQSVDEKGRISVAPYDFYLTKGTHTLKFEVALGDMSNVLNTVNDCLTKLNSYYLKILMITGPTPDEYRDYGFTSLIPDVMTGLVEQAQVLYDVSAELERITGQKGENSVLLDKIALIVERMGSDDDKVAPNLGSLKDNIGSLGTWINSSQSQPLTLDYILVQSSDNSEIPDANSGFFKGLAYEFKSFIMSFVSDYNNLGAMDLTNDAENPIDVWMTSGRDQATIIRSMLTDFIAETGIPVNLKLVAAGSLLPATLAGTGPDVSIQNASTNVINYAIRNAVLPITEMEGLDDVMTRFDSSAFVPLSLYGEIYGLPETETFPMLFIRMDVFAELGMEIPETWDDLYDLLPVIQSNNLQVGFPSQQAGLTLLMYQKDEPMYKGAVSEEEMAAKGFEPAEAYKTEGMEINLNSNTALDCFKQLCELYTMYSFPLTFDFANRFRTGEMPIAVADYTSYNQMTIFAPEISGLWKISTLPGTATYVKDENGDFIYDEDGEKVIESINYDSVATVTAAMMMRGARGDEERSWEFMKWWTSKEPQTTYGNELVALLGASGQYATANLEALENQPWGSDVLAALKDQFSNLSVTPEMPGGYIITRYIQFAFLSAYNDNKNPVEEMLGYIDTINSELSRKREEFDLLTLEDFRSEE